MNTIGRTPVSSFVPSGRPESVTGKLVRSTASWGIMDHGQTVTPVSKSRWVTCGHIREIGITIKRLGFPKAQPSQKCWISSNKLSHFLLRKTFHWAIFKGQRIHFTSFTVVWPPKGTSGPSTHVTTAQFCALWEHREQKQALENEDFSPRFKIRQKSGTLARSLIPCPSS